MNLKALLPFLILLTTSIITHAQEPADALRTSWAVPGGTARAQAIGGAMGSLGGDITTTFVNPAGLGFYRTGDLVITPRFRFGNTSATYIGEKNKQASSKFNLGTSGVVWGAASTTGKLHSAALSLAYNRTADFNNQLFYQGINNRSTYASRYLEEVEGQNANNVATNYPFGASLALNTYYIDTISGPNGSVAGLQTKVPVATGLIQRQSLRETGGIDEFAIGGALNVEDKTIIGLTIGRPFLRYNRTGSFAEADATDNPNNGFNAMVLDEDLETRGQGYNAKLGVIFKIQETWRLGFAFHTPTFFNLTDRYYVNMSTDTEGYQGEFNQNSEDLNGGTSEFGYRLNTPYKALASLSYVLRETADVSKQRGFLTADVEFVNYKSATFYTDDNFGYDQTTEEYLRSLNTAIDAAYKSAFNMRVGGELKFTTFMVRAGAAYYGNPYQNINNDEGSRLNLSGGVGFRDKGFFADLTYVHAINRDTRFPYRLQDKESYFGADIRQTAGNVMLTIGFKL